MAVVALRGFQVTKLRYLSVERFEVTLRNLAMTAAALVHDVKPEIREIGPLNAVR